ncbi:MAG: hypothetical protein AB7G11_14840 [Phycisphaerales bacterium]
MIGAVAGLVGLSVESVRDGDIRTPPTLDQSGIDPSPRDFLIVVAVHPRCPCTIATLENLRQLATECGPRLDVRVQMCVPAGASPDWSTGRAWDIAARIPHARIVVDTDARESLRIGARTSGSCVLYRRDGTPVFHGGITTLRGHVGMNSITDSIKRVVLEQATRATPAPVFGCALVPTTASTSCCQAEDAPADPTTIK